MIAEYCEASVKKREIIDMRYSDAYTARQSDRAQTVRDSVFETKMKCRGEDSRHSR
jgi:hypothetical protein